MMASGNGEAAVCAENLLRTVRGEVPMARVKGLSREFIDRSAPTMGALSEDVEWVLETFEPRLDAEEVEVYAADAAAGDFEMEALAAETE